MRSRHRIQILRMTGSIPSFHNDFLSALEESGSVGDRTGWVPNHIAIEDSSGDVLAVCPAYLKTHSQGSMFSTTAGPKPCSAPAGRYYPKLQVAIPFTPATGPRLLVRHDTAYAPALLRAGLIDALRQSAESQGAPRPM